MLLRALIATCVFAAALFAAVEEKATHRKTFAVSNPQAARVEVDNVFGDIRVTAGSGREIAVVANERVTADTKEKLAEARQEVKLDMTQKGDTVRLYVDGPFRCDCGDCKDKQGRRKGGFDGYRVHYDFEIQAPAGSSLWLRTINDGEIRVNGIAGDYNAENINGGIEFLEAAGSGRIYALNGGVKVTFRNNPRAASTFGSLNGEVELHFQPDLAADFRIKTFNGEVYTDFPVTSLPLQPASFERRNGRLTRRGDRYTGVRVGAGGPEIKLDGFNGDMRILKRAR